MDEMSSTNGGCSGEEDFLGVLLGLRPNTGAARRGRVRESGWSKVTDLKFEQLYDSWFLKEVLNQPSTVHVPRIKVTWVMVNISPFSN